MGIQISEEAKTRYIQRRQKDILDCREAMAKSNFKFIQNLGHQLKGSAVTFGHQKLSDLGEILEDKAIENDMVGVDAIVTQIEDYLKAY